MKKTRNLTALLLAAIMLVTVFQISAMAADPAALRVALISDTHLLPDAMNGGVSDIFLEATGNRGKPSALSETMLAAALAAIKQRAKTEKIDYLLIPGDLSLNSEYDAHVLMARLLKQFEKDSGIPVAVVPGNHDIEHSGAADYSTGVKTQPRRLTADEFFEIYAKFGYDLPGCERMEGTLTYAANLGSKYRLIAIDSDLYSLEGAAKKSEAELRDWVVGQCKKAKAAGRTVIGMGHHNLAEQLGGQETIMRNFGFDDVRGIAEAFADAGMHFYFSGHVHLSEIGMRVSDSGQPLYDICIPSSNAFPGTYRVVKFSASGKRVEADVRSHLIPFKFEPPFPGQYYKTLFGVTYGGTDGGGFTGFIRGSLRRALAPLLSDFYIPKSVQKALFAFVNSLIDEAFALEVSELPYKRFIKEYGFGDPNKPGTVEDVGNSAVVYMFAKNLDPADDPFIQDFLRRLRNGEFLDQALSFAVPAIMDALRGGTLSVLYTNPLVTALREGMMALVVNPGMRATLSESLYQTACDFLTSCSPTGSCDGRLVYNGPVKVPTDPGTYRLPQDLSACPKGLTHAEVTWLTKPSVRTPALKITDKDGNPAPEVKVTISSKAQDITAGQLDIAIMKILGRTQPVLQHTARLSGLRPGKAYLLTAGDSQWDWWGEPRSFKAARG